MAAKSFRKLKPFIARTRAAFAGIGQSGKLAPGELNADESIFLRDQFYLLGQQQKYGNIFKTWWGGKLTTCLVGHADGQEFLTKNKANLRAATIDMTPLFPLGFMRALEGDAHKKYRNLFLSAFRAVDMAKHDATIRETINRCLTPLCDGDGIPDNEDIARAMKHATSTIMIQIILGAQAGTEMSEKLLKAYDIYTPNGMYLVIGDEQKSKYAPIKLMVEEHAKTFDANAGEPTSLLEYIVRAGRVDDTVIGNLIHMTEFARTDVHGLWRWILLEISNHPDYLNSIIAEKDTDVRKKRAESVVSETLRMQQSEFIYRAVTKTFSYQGVLYPKRSRVRICIWEGHRDPNIFENPNEFRPDRFVTDTFGAGAYAPLGMGHHACLGANWTMICSRILVEELAEHYRLKQISYGTPKKGHFHFEPGSDSVLSIERTG